MFFLCDLLDPLRFDCEIVANAKLATETIAGFAGPEPVVLVIAVLPPGGMARSRSLCRQLRARFRHLKVLVLSWQYVGDQNLIRQSFISAGADSVSFSLVETRALLADFAGEPVARNKHLNSLRQDVPILKSLSRTDNGPL